jgi:hypothetical protein
MNEFSRVEDILYSLNSYTHLKFHTKITEYIDGRTKSSHNEYKTSTRNTGSIVIKRKLNFYLTLDYSKDNNKNSVLFLPEQMPDIIEKFNYIKNNWFNPATNYNIFGLINGKLSVINQSEKVIVQCVCDKFLRIDPAVFITDTESKLAVTLYIGDLLYPITILSEKFSAMTYLLSTLDMLNYANTSLSITSLRTSPINRISFVDGESEESIMTKSGKVGRDFKFKQDQNII